MLGILPKCFKKQSQSSTWQTKLKEIAPSFGIALSKDEKQLHETRNRTAKILRMGKS
jgi:malate dehydrogenase (quinone)